MNRTIEYIIDKEHDGLRIELFLKRKGYSSQNLTEIKHMPKSVIVNGEHYYMKQELHEGDHLSIHIQENECSEKIPPTKLPLDIVYEDE
ncbi:MAG: RluA family pseudouridine synthase, partial [Dorea sp.]